MYEFQEKDKVAYERDTVRPLLSQFEKWLTGKEYLVGNRLTFTDFIFFEVLVDFPSYSGSYNVFWVITMFSNRK